MDTMERKKNRMKRTGILGGGASGMMAAIAAAQGGAEVTILECRDRVGRKLLATGNGKCNLSNTDFCIERDYRGHDSQRLSVFFERFGVADTIDFFRSRGMLVSDRGGYLYPRSGQASGVLELFTGELARLGIRVVCDCRVTAVEKKEDFLVSTSQGNFSFDTLVLACGSNAGTKPKDGLGGYELARSLGLSVYEPLPALVQLRCKESFFKSISGVRCMAEITLCRSGEKGPDPVEYGELQLTDYGISGIPVFQLSRYASQALYHRQKVTAVLDFVPEIPLQEWYGFCQEQYRICQGRSAEQAGCGLLPKKLTALLLSQCGLKPGELIGPGTKKQFFALFSLMRQFRVTVTAANPAENAQVCMGGVALSQVKDNLEARKIPGLFLCGEILDVDGRCGGYNLQWAWTSGFLAGQAAAHKAKAKKQ